MQLDFNRRTYINQGSGFGFKIILFRKGQKYGNRNKIQILDNCVMNISCDKNIQYFGCLLLLNQSCSKQYINTNNNNF